MVMILNPAKMLGHTTHVDDPEKVGEQWNDPIYQKTNPKVEYDARSNYGSVKSKSQIFQMTRNFHSVTGFSQVLDRIEAAPVFQRNQDHVPTRLWVLKHFGLFSLPVWIFRLVHMSMMRPMRLPENRHCT